MQEVLTFTCCNLPHLSQTTCPTCGRRILEGDFRPLGELPPALQEAHRKGWGTSSVTDAL